MEQDRQQRTIAENLDHARRILGALPEEPSDLDTLLELVGGLGRLRELVDDVLNEAMAEATLAGASIRKVADCARLSPNAVPPRLARTNSLAPYSSAGTVSSPSIERARYDADLGRSPEQAIPASPKPKIRFQRRNS